MQTNMKTGKTKTFVQLPTAMDMCLHEDIVMKI